MSIFFPEDEGREVPCSDNQPILRTELVTGAAGPTGSQGPAGPVGVGVVSGGFTGQVLAKKSNANYDTEWVTGGGGGGSAIWGGIAGTLSNQLDLQTVLDAKAPSSGISPSAISGTAVITTDSRLSDSRTPTGAASGDLGGTYPSPSVVKLQGYSVATTAPITGQSLGWTGSEWSAVTPLTSVTWGGITGTLANQTDLQSALDAKALKITAITAGTGLTGGGDLSQSRIISMLADVPADSLNFNTAATETAAIGKMFWNTTEGTPQVGLAGGNVQLQMGSMLVSYVRNAEATTLNKGEVVYLFGATGNRASVKRASNVADLSSSKTIGLVAESIGANQNGFIITQGVLDGLSLGSPYVSGDSIYLDTTPGAFTRVKPTQPDHIVFLGVVERANAGNGQLYIRPQNGFELEELHDVLITSPINNQTILWNSAVTLWTNSTLTVGTISGLSADLSGKVTSVGATSPVVSSGGTTPTISIPVATATTSGYISSTDWTTFNAKAKTTDVQIFTRGTLFTTTATAFTSGSPTITVASNANMVVGMAITAPFLPTQTSGIPTTITNISGTTITVSGNATYNYSDRNIATTIGFATSLYTWTKPTGAKSVDVFCIAGGGAGAGGRVNAGLQGGGAGAGGGLNFRTQIPATILSATEPVFVGIEGIGGTATNQINSQNIAGGAGFDSSFGAISAITTNPFVFAGGGGGGSGAAGGNGSASIRNVNVAGAGGAGGSAAAGAAGSSSFISAAGGGGGGGANTTSFFNGGNGQWVLGNNPVGGQSQSSGVEGTNGAAGTSMGTYIHAGGGGSGGVGAYTGKNAGAGGNGGLYGGGGGGGGCLGNFNASFFSGKGGDGGQGIVIVTTYF